MLLLDLDPRWFRLEDEGPRVGLTFECPHCRVLRLAVCFHHSATRALDDQYILARRAAVDVAHIWDLRGQDDFATLTLWPSIDASASGHWHGWIREGRCE